MPAKPAKTPAKPVTRNEVRRFLKDGRDAFSAAIRGGDPANFDAEELKLDERYKRALKYLGDLEKRAGANTPTPA